MGNTAVKNLQYNLTSVGLADAPMYSGSHLRVERDNTHLSNGSFHLINGAALGKNPRNHLQISQCFGRKGGIKLGILTITGKIEESGSQSGFIDTLNNELFLSDSTTDHTIAGSELQAIVAYGGIRGKCLPTRNDNILTGDKPCRPFDGAGMNKTAIFGCKRNSSTCHNGQCATGYGRKAHQKFLQLFHKKSVVYSII